MAADATRLPQGIIINHSLTLASPVGTVIENLGALFISTNASVATYVPVTSGLGHAITDPGSGAAIPVTASGQISLTTGTGAETNTMAIPAFIGEQIGIILGTAGGGTRTITVASAINQAGNTKMAFTQANDAIILTSFSSAGTLLWRVTYNDGVTLS